MSQAEPLGPAPALQPEETADSALGGAVRLIQPRRGFRFGIDSVLLARFAAEQPVDAAVDLGCGCGVVSLCLLALGGAAQVSGCDLQGEMVERATRAAQWNGCAGRAVFRQLDLRAAAAALPGGRAALVVSNPPYRPLGEGRLSPIGEVALARHEVECGLEDVARAAAHLLARGGQLCLVYPAARIGHLVRVCGAEGFAPAVLRFVHPARGRPASLVLARLQRCWREATEVRAPLFLHGRDRKYSREAERLLGRP